jgi:Flp pilus assembly pilin Flp
MDRTMRSILGRLRRFCRRNQGATSVEYALALALILAFCFPAISSLGGALVSSFTKANGAFQTGSGTSAPTSVFSSVPLKPASGQ